MPTAGRLAGAVIFFLFGWYMAGLTLPFFPDENAPNLWLPAVSFTGLFLGWRICGRSAGKGYSNAVTLGLTVAAFMAFVSLFIIAFNEMIKRAMDMRYRGGTMEAVVDVFNQMIEFSVMFADVTLIANLFIGGVICAWMTEYFARRYP